MYAQSILYKHSFSPVLCLNEKVIQSGHGKRVTVRPSNSHVMTIQNDMLYYITWYNTLLISFEQLNFPHTQHMCDQINGMFNIRELKDLQVITKKV